MKLSRGLLSIALLKLRPVWHATLVLTLPFTVGLCRAGNPQPADHTNRSTAACSAPIRGMASALDLLGFAQDVRPGSASHRLARYQIFRIPPIGDSRLRSAVRSSSVSTGSRTPRTESPRRTRAEHRTAHAVESQPTERASVPPQSSELSKVDAAPALPNRVPSLEPQDELVASDKTARPESSKPSLPIPAAIASRAGPGGRPTPSAKNIPRPDGAAPVDLVTPQSPEYPVTELPHTSVTIAAPQDAALPVPAFEIRRVGPQLRGPAPATVADGIHPAKAPERVVDRAALPDLEPPKSTCNSDNAKPSIPPSDPATEDLALPVLATEAPRAGRGHDRAPTAAELSSASAAVAEPVTDVPEFGDLFASISPKRPEPVISSPAGPVPSPEDLALPVPASEGGQVERERDWSAPVPRVAPAVADQGRRLIEEGIGLAERGALYSARARFVMALRLVTQALDTQTQSQRFSQALADGLCALSEAHDFQPRGSRLEAQLDLTQVVSTHRTTVLKAADLTQWTAMAAQQRYHVYAEKQLSRAGGDEIAAADALYGLARLQPSLNSGSDQQQSASGPTAMSLYQAALMIHPKHYLAANELGTLFAHFGQWANARDVLRHAAAARPECPIVWQNLARVHDQLGEHELAALARRESQVALRLAEQPAAADRRPAVQWVDADTFAALSREGSRPPNGRTDANRLRPTAVSAGRASRTLSDRRQRPSSPSPRDRPFPF